VDGSRILASFKKGDGHLADMRFSCIDGVLARSQSPFLNRARILGAWETSSFSPEPTATAFAVPTVNAGCQGRKLRYRRRSLQRRWSVAELRSHAGA
jgi:hypothetical protein